MKPGDTRGLETRRKKGEKPWNEGTRQYTQHVCEKCGKGFELVKGSAASGKYCSTECAYSERMGAKHGNWKGGRYVIGSGYVVVHAGAGKVQHEHRVIAEKALGRPLKSDECVHHINNDKQDNDPRNLLDRKSVV